MEKIMKRLHVNVAVSDLEASMRFYTSLFAAEPTLVKTDYAKWMLDDPHVNFAITTRGDRKGIDHLGIQVENEAELSDIYGRLKAAGGPMIEQGETTCCYAKSEKNWIADPEGIAWETFLTKGESPVYGVDTDLRDRLTACCAKPQKEEAGPATSCCGPAATSKSSRTTG
jgi:catechol 2,3-dioxygenase-like lactoylglutathione lyase family enzyme